MGTLKRQTRIWGKVNSPILWELAKNNRLHPTEAEAVMWEHLRGKFYGTKFRRQQIIGNYIADFISKENNLVIEIDGGYHDSAEQQEYDKERTEYLNSLGLVVMRFTNEEVLGDIDSVLYKIKQYIIKELTPPQPSPTGGRGMESLNSELIINKEQ